MPHTVPPFNPDEFQGPLCGYDGPAQRDEPHSHASGQCLYSMKGIMEVEGGGRLFIEPPHNAIWIPPGMMHRSIAKNPVQFRAIFIASELCDSLGDDAQILAVTPLLCELIDRICQMTSDLMDNEESLRLAYVTLDELKRAPARPFSFEISSHSLIQRIYTLMQEPEHLLLTSE